MLIYFIILWCLAILGLVTGAFVLVRSNPLRLKYAVA